MSRIAAASFRIFRPGVFFSCDERASSEESCSHKDCRLSAHSMSSVVRIIAVLCDRLFAGQLPGQLSCHPDHLPYLLQTLGQIREGLWSISVLPLNAALTELFLKGCSLLTFASLDLCAFALNFTAGTSPACRRPFWPSSWTSCPFFSSWSASGRTC